MITLGLPLYIGAHTVTSGATVASMSAATWASPSTYLEAVLSALSETASVVGVAPNKLRLVTGFGPSPLVFQSNAAGTLAGEYVGATSLSLAFSVDSKATSYIWTGQPKRLPGLQPKLSSWHQFGRSGVSGQPGALIEDVLAVWCSTGVKADLEAWYEFAQTWLAGSGAVELRGDTTQVWYLGITDIAIETASSDGLYSSCSLPVVRGA